MMKDRTVYVDIGGEQTIVAIVNEFYNSLVNDDKLSHYFREANIHHIRLSHITMLVSFLFGVPNRYHGRNMRKIHQGLQITSEEYESAVIHYEPPPPVEAEVSYHQNQKTFTYRRVFLGYSTISDRKVSGLLSKQQVLEVPGSEQTIYYFSLRRSVDTLAW